MRSPEVGRQDAPKERKSRIKTMAQAMTLGIVAVATTLAAACEAPQGKYDRTTSTPTNAVKPIELTPTGFKPHCIVLYPGEEPILDHAKFACDPDGKPQNVNNSIDTTPIPIGAGGGISFNAGQTP